MPLISTLECYRMLLDRLATARYTGKAQCAPNVRMDHYAAKRADA